MRVLPGFTPPSFPTQLHHAPQRDRATIRITTFNDDFTDEHTDLRHVHGGVVMVQEAKNVDVRGVVDQQTYDTFQNRKTDARAGSALYFKQDRFSVRGHGQKLLASPDGNDDMLKRYVSWNDLKVKGKDITIRMASAHRPPGDEKDEWPEFDRNLAEFAAKARRDGVPVVIGMDANQENPQALAKKCGLVWHAPKGSIDGFLASPEVRFNGVPKRGTDKYSEGHTPVSASITVLEPKKKNAA